MLLLVVILIIIYFLIHYVTYISKIKTRAIIYTIVNAGIINLSWTFLVTLGIYLPAKTPNFFNNVIEPTFLNLFAISAFAGLILSLFGSLALRFDKAWAKKVLLLGVWITIIHPSLPIFHSLLVVIFGRSGISYLSNIFINLIVSGLNFGVAHYIIKEPK